MRPNEAKAGMARPAGASTLPSSVRVDPRYGSLPLVGRAGVGVREPQYPGQTSPTLDPSPPGGGRRLRRLIGGAIAALACLATPALGGDRAGIGFIGYSDDYRYFAFEEFGTQDGSGFAYANLYVLDLTIDQWVKDTPVRKRIDEETSTIAAVRADARDAAQPILDRLNIAEPVDIIALNGDGVDSDNQTLRFGAPGDGMAAPDPTYELALANVDAALGMPECAEWGEADVTGFALTLTVDGESREVYRDDTVPKSRGCVRGYRLYGVVIPFDSYAAFAPDLTPGMVAIVSVYSMGFEGPDRRFIAVPLER